MDKPSFDLFANYRTSQAQSILFGNVMATLMMVSMAIAVVQFGARLSPGWNGSYLVWVCLLISIESIYTRQHARNLDTQEHVIFRVSEWIAISVAIKLLIYLVRGPQLLLQDLPQWQAHFLESFFTGEYVLALIVALVAWINSAGFAGDLESLYDRDQDTGWDELGKLQNALNDARKRISTRIFIMGMIVVIMAALSRLDATMLLRQIGKPPPGYIAPVINVIAYFIMALLMLSQTQFALMRIRWLWQRLPISPELAKNWIRYGILFILALGVIVLFLPTEYSIGLFDMLRLVLNFLIRAVMFLLLVITFPFTWCLSLFRVSQNQALPSPPPVLPPSQPPLAKGEPIAWLEILRSLAFWIIFLGVIIFAVRFYLMQNASLWKAITSFPLFRWIDRAWKGFLKWARGANRQITGLVQDGFKRLRAQRMVVPAQAIRRIFNFARLNPRERIIYFYLNLIRLGGEQGLERRPSQTPLQYENRLNSAIPEASQELHDLTGSFIEARYSQHPIEPPKAEHAGSLWERIKALLKQLKHEE